MLRRLSLLAGLLLVFGVGCQSSNHMDSPVDERRPNEESPRSGGEQTDGGTENPGEGGEQGGSDERPDDNPEQTDPGDNESDDGTTDPGNEGGTEDPGSGNEETDSTGFPETITTDGGEQLSGNIEAGEQISMTLQANQADFIVARLEPAGNQQPGLTLERGDEQIAWHEAESAGETAHIPYQDQQLQSGWEFYEGGTHTLIVRNVGSSAGKFNFELVCKSGPCTNGTDGGNDGDNQDGSDGNQEDGNNNNGGGDSNGVQEGCPTATGSQLEQLLRQRHRPNDSISYDQARDAIWSDIYNNNGNVEGVYTGETVQTNSIPNPNEFNTEHGIPRSKIEGGDVQFSDIHHLFPAESNANAKRSNLPFDNVTSPEWSSNGSRRGANSRGWKVFEPRDARKGDLARAAFYFAVVYDRDLGIDAEQDGWGIGLGNESTLRNWHNQDPVSSGERSRNQAIEQLQGNINPFIKCPGLVSKISDF